VWHLEDGDGGAGGRGRGGHALWSVDERVFMSKIREREEERIVECCDRV